MDIDTIVIGAFIAIVFILPISIAIYNFRVRQKKLNDIISKCDKVNELCDEIIRTLQDARNNGH